MTASLQSVTSTDLIADPLAAAAQAANDLARLTGVERHDLAIVLGSGWVPAADLLGDLVVDIPSTDLHGFPAPSVEGHAGRVRSIRCGDRNVIVFLGRTHVYEGLGVEAVAHSVRTAAAAGCRAVILTNACGGLNPEWSPGTPVLISDHINLTGVSPIRGAHFVDVTDLYSPRLRGLCRAIDPSLAEGVYVQFRGPQYETPAEIRMVRAMGGDLVGMSTTIEAVAAREAGLEILGVSLVTNLAAGMTGERLDHEEVLAAGRAAATRMGTLLGSVLAQA